MIDVKLVVHTHFLDCAVSKSFDPYYNTLRQSTFEQASGSILFIPAMLGFTKKTEWDNFGHTCIHKPYRRLPCEENTSNLLLVGNIENKSKCTYNSPPAIFPVEDQPEGLPQPSELAEELPLQTRERAIRQRRVS